MLVAYDISARITNRTLLCFPLQTFTVSTILYFDRNAKMAAVAVELPKVFIYLFIHVTFS